MISNNLEHPLQYVHFGVHQLKLLLNESGFYRCVLLGCDDVIFMQTVIVKKVSPAY